MHILGLRVGLRWSTDIEPLKVLSNRLSELSTNETSCSSAQLEVGVSHTNTFLPNLSSTLVPVHICVVPKV